jgi:hypothetical protein
MNIKTKKLKLMGKGLSESTLSKLTDSEVNTLFEQVTQTNKQVQITKIPQNTARTTGGVVNGVSIKQDAAGNIIATKTEQELGEELDDNDSLGALSLQKITGQQTPHDASDMAPDGMDDDSDDDRKMMDEEKKKKKEKYNPWAVCTAQMGKDFGTTKRSDWSKADLRKYERCVKDVKKTIDEGKNPVSLFVEQKITQIVEKHLSPSITKKELLKFLSEAPATAPSKPTTAPTKPATKPGTRPSSPGKNPFPKEHPAPKANRPSPEIAKKKVIDLIKNIIEN